MRISRPTLERATPTVVSATLLLATLLLPTVTAAQATSAPRVLRLPASTRAMALGDAFMLGAGSSNALFYHPALVQGAEGFGLAVQSWSGEATQASASATTEWYGGSVAVGVQTLQYGTPDAAAFPTGQDLLFREGATPVSERVAILGFAREVFGIRVGVAGKLLDERVGTERDASGAVDLGVATEVGPLTMALSAQNLGPDLTFADDDVSLPRRYTLGASTDGKEVGPLDVGLTGALQYEEIEDELIPAAGLEVGYWPVRGRTFVGRVGVRRVPSGDASPLSLGFAFWGDDLVLEWAWRPFGGAVDEGTHRFGVAWK